MRTTHHQPHPEHLIDHDLWSWARESQVHSLERRANRHNRSRFQRLWTTLRAPFQTKEHWTMQ